MVECSKWDLIGHLVRKLEDSNESNMDLIGHHIRRSEDGGDDDNMDWGHSSQELSEGSNISNWTVYLPCDILVDLCPSPKNLSQALSDEFGANFIGRGDFKAGCNWLCGLVTSGYSYVGLY